MIDNKNISKDSLISLLRVNYSCIYSDRILDYNNLLLMTTSNMISHIFDDNVEYRTYKETYWETLMSIRFIKNHTITTMITN